MGEYLQEAVLPVQYDNYVFGLYGTLVDIHTEEDFPKPWEKLALFFDITGPFMNRRNCRSAMRHLSATVSAR